jgi:hypothetical protein
MSGDATWLIEAIENRKLVQRLMRNQITLFEPQAYVRIGGGRDAMIGYQVAGASQYHAEPNQWFVLPLDEGGLVPDPARRFSAVRKAPPHIQDLIQKIYLQAKAK